MGLFGKRKKLESGLDIPPAPPPVKVTGEVVAAPATEVPKPELPTFPEIPPLPGKLPSFEEELKMEERAPPVSKAVKKEVVPPPIEEVPPPPMGEVPLPAEIPPPIGAKPEVKAPGKLEVGEAPPEPPSFEAVEEEVSEEEKAAMEAPAKGPIFIRASNYKYVLDELNVARNAARESGEMFAGIGDINASSEQEYEHWRLCLEDIERKMLYVDKSLFGKG